MCELNALEANCKGPEAIECFGNLSFEAFSKDALSDWFHEKPITSKFAVAALLVSDSILDAIRLQIRRLSKINVDVDDLKSLLSDEVIKRELIDGDEANSASAFLKKLQRRMNAKRNGSDDDDEDSSPAIKPALTPAGASVSGSTLPETTPITTPVSATKALGLNCALRLPTPRRDDIARRPVEPVAISTATL